MISFKQFFMLLAIIPSLLLGAFSSLHHSIPKLLFSASFSTQDISLCLHCVPRNRHRTVATLHVYCFIFTLLIADYTKSICRMIRIIFLSRTFIDSHTTNHLNYTSGDVISFYFRNCRATRYNIDRSQTMNSK